MEVKIKYLDDVRVEQHGDWIDLRSAEDVVS